MNVIVIWKGLSHRICKSNSSIKFPSLIVPTSLSIFTYFYYMVEYIPDKHLVRTLIAFFVVDI